MMIRWRFGSGLQAGPCIHDRRPPTAVGMHYWRHQRYADCSGDWCRRSVSASRPLQLDFSQTTSKARDVATTGWRSPACLRSSCGNSPYGKFSETGGRGLMPIRASKMHWLRYRAEQLFVESKFDSAAVRL